MGLTSFQLLHPAIRSPGGEFLPQALRSLNLLLLSFDTRTKIRAALLFYRLTSFRYSSGEGCTCSSYDADAGNHNLLERPGSIRLRVKMVDAAGN